MAGIFRWALAGLGKGDVTDAAGCRDVVSAEASLNRNVSTAPGTGGDTGRDPDGDSEGRGAFAAVQRPREGSLDAELDFPSGEAAVEFVVMHAKRHCVKLTVRTSDYADPPGAAVPVAGRHVKRRTRKQRQDEGSVLSSATLACCVAACPWQCRIRRAGTQHFRAVVGSSGDGGKVVHSHSVGPDVVVKDYILEDAVYHYRFTKMGVVELVGYLNNRYGERYKIQIDEKILCNKLVGHTREMNSRRPS